MRQAERMGRPKGWLEKFQPLALSRLELVFVIIDHSIAVYGISSYASVRCPSNMLEGAGVEHQFLIRNRF